MRFRETLLSNGEYEVILAQTNAGKVNFISLDDGNRFFTEVSVQNVNKITEEEFQKLIGQGCNRYNWELIT